MLVADIVDLVQLQIEKSVGRDESGEHIRALHVCTLNIQIADHDGRVHSATHSCVELIIKP